MFSAAAPIAEMVAPADIVAARGRAWCFMRALHEVLGVYGGVGVGMD
jgi:hypothetical protein